MALNQLFHFPTVGHFEGPCIPTGVEFEYFGHYPFGDTLENAMWRYWIAKSYRLHGSLTLAPMGGGDPVVHTCDVTLPGYELVTTEADLACGEQEWRAIDMFSSALTSHIQLFGRGPGIADTTPILLEFGEYRPLFDFSLQTSAGYCVTNPPDSGATESSAWVSFLDPREPTVVLIQLYHEEGVLDNVTGDLFFEPVEWWPYDPGDGGGPVFDSVSGSLLRPEALLPGFKWW